MSKQQRDALDAAMRTSPFDTSMTPGTHRADFEERLTPPLPDDVTGHDVRVGGVPALRLDVPGATRPGTLVYFFGGGYVVGSPRSGARLAVALARRTGLAPVAVEYRRAPEHRFPAPVDDALAFYRGLLDDGTPAESVVLAGDSAGGGLAVALMLAARDAGLPLPAGAVVFSAWADLTLTSPTFETKHGIDPLFSRAAMAWYAGHYLDGADPAQPLASPALADLTGLPPLLVQAGSHEVLLGDSVRLAAAAAAADVDVRLEVTPDVPHVFQNAFGALDEADAALDRAADFLVSVLERRALERPAPERPAPEPVTSLSA
ncbi:MAG: alpha/beta hydrolase [Promicromonosporaceae bacterium]|nr:alpha/beta hydrolase [Promicromonosporaceae bacterium]